MTQNNSNVIEVQGMNNKSPSFKSIKSPEKINTLRVFGENRNTLLASKPKENDFNKDTPSFSNSFVEDLIEDELEENLSDEKSLIIHNNYSIIKPNDSTNCEKKIFSNLLTSENCDFKQEKAIEEDKSLFIKKQRLLNTAEFTKRPLGSSNNGNSHFYSVNSGSCNNSPNRRELRSLNKSRWEALATPKKQTSPKLSPVRRRTKLSVDFVNILPKLISEKKDEVDRHSHKFRMISSAMMGINRANIYGVKATEIPLFREAILIAFNLNILFHKKIETQMIMFSKMKSKISKQNTSKMSKTRRILAIMRKFSKCSSVDCETKQKEFLIKTK